MVDRNTLAGFLIFKDIGAAELGTILIGAQESSYDAGAVVLQEDEAGPDPDLFIIVDGRVEVLIEYRDARSGIGRNKRVAILKAGEVFGEIGLLEGRRRSAQIKAYSKLTVLRLGRKQLFDHLAKNPQVGYLIMRNVASILSDRLVDLNFLWRDEV
jgi:CRP/FNR family cyclic AMP-dependent transcriptional regulator